MGTSLTGLTPSTTYDALIKVGDNGPLSATAKYLSDGLGNDSVLALSTSRLGVGTASPVVDFQVNGAAEVTQAFSVAGTRYLQIYTDGTIGTINGLNSAPLVFSTSTGTSFAERMRITSAGNVGIGTSTPSATLDIVGSSGSEQFRIGNLSGGTDFGITVIENDSVVLNSAEATTSRDLVIQTGGVERARFSQNGLSFNGDTAAANALDDYEEGTFSPFFTFGGGSTGITYANRAGSYTKIGNQVSVNIYMELTNKGSSTGSALVGGLPFTIGSGASRYGAISIWINNINFANQIFGRYVINDTTFFLTETTEAGVTTALDNTNFANTSEIMISATYFV